METYINYNGHFAIDFVAGSDEYNTWSTFALVPEKKPVAVPPAIQGGTLTAGNGEWRFYLKDNEESYSQYLDIIADIDRKNFTVRLHHSPDDITEYEEYTAFITVGAPQTDENHTIITISAVLYPSAAEWAEHDEELSITFGADQSTSYNTWTDWHLIPDKTLKIVPPQLKEKYVDIPGRNGAIDLCNAVVGLPRFERMTGSLSFTIYDNDPDTIYNDMLDNLHGHKFDEVEIMGKSYDGRWVIESYEPDGEEPKITLGYNLILHDWTFNEDGDGTIRTYADGFIGFIDHFPGKSIPPDLTSDNRYQAMTQFKSVTSQSVTYEIFGYFHTKKKYARLVDIPGANYFRICFETDGDDNTDFKISVSYNNWNIASYPTTASYVFPHDEWITIGIVIDANSLRLYKNGELVETRSDFTSASLPNKTLDYWTYNLGYTTELSGRYITGCIETFRLYDRALTPEELFGNYKTDISKMKIYGINCNQQSLGGGSA